MGEGDCDAFCERVVGIHELTLFQFQTMPIQCNSGCTPSILTLMLHLFFQKSENPRIVLSATDSYLQFSNNLDSQYYALERVKGADQNYLHQRYFLEPHPQVVNYYTSWHEKEVLQEDNPVPKKPKDKKSGLVGFLNKKSKTEHKPQPHKQPKEEVAPKTVLQDVLYVQLESFLQVNVPSNLTDVKEFMALIYLLAQRVYETFKCWPHMIPVIVESRKFKFIKKGGTLHHELVTLFETVAKDKKLVLLAEWSQPLSNLLAQTGSQEQKESILGSFLKRELQAILERQYTIGIRKGQELTPQTVLIVNPFTLALKEEMSYLNIDEYEISYFHKKNETRQVTLEHCLEQPLTLEGERNHLIIKYLKQFMMG